MEDEKLIQLLDEKFREAAMNTERIERDLTFLNLKVDNVGGRINHLTDEVALPSGVIAQRFSAVDQRLEAVDQRLEAVDQRLEAVDQRLDAVEKEARLAHVRVEDVRGEIQFVADGVKMVNEKLDRFRAEVEER
jgi:chromosome segregation ATPase